MDLCDEWDDCDFTPPALITGDTDDTIVLRLKNKISTLFDAIKHGDKEHQEWLRKKIEDHFNETA